ncbi:MAG: D-allose transporter subunit [Tenericutes bacterium ADurb.Bin239]|nr:MAG: D-allose transporter subunit [Tenericutes bacterium ADurb.Bin239]
MKRVSRKKGTFGPKLKKWWKAFVAKLKKWWKQVVESTGVEKFLATIIAILAGLLFGLIVMLLISFNDPLMAFEGLGAILSAGFSKGLKSIGEVLFRAAPLILTGLSVAFAFKTGLFNIGASGQVMMGAFLAVFVGIKTESWILALISGVLGGALWALIPALLKAYRNVHEVVATIMMNYVAMYSSKMLIEWLICMPVHQQSRPVPAGGQLPTLGLDKLFNQDRLNSGIVIAIITTIIIFVLLEKTTFGYQLKAVGFNREAARYAGINDKRNIVLSLVIAGALAGLAGAVIYLVPSTGERLQTKHIISNYGFQGIAVALLGMSHPIGTLGAGLFFGYIEAANLPLQGVGYKREIIDIISASIIYFSAFTLFFQIYARRLINKIRDFAGKLKKKPKLATAEGVEIAELPPPNEETTEGGQEDDRE